MALGFGEITPAGHIEFGCPDLVGLVGDKVPPPKHNPSHARARTHAHTRIYAPRASASLALPPVRPAAQLASTCRGEVPFAAVLEAVGATRWEDEPAYL